VMRIVGNRPNGQRLRALIVLLRRAGLRISEALALRETDLDSFRGAILVRRGPCRIRHGPLGLGPTRPLATDPSSAPGRSTPLCDPDRGTALGGVRRPQAAPSRRLSRRHPATVRAAPATARPRRRDGARRRPARRHPAPTRACRPRRHHHLPARDRQRRDHQHRPRTTVADDLRKRRPDDQSVDRTTAEPAAPRSARSPCQVDPRLARRNSPAPGLSPVLLLRWRGTTGLVKPASQLECPRSQSAWTAVPLCSVTIVAFSNQAGAAEDISAQLAVVSCQWLAMPAGDA
jgi:hypothetical protein